MATYTPSTGPGAGTSLVFHLLVDPPDRETVQLMNERLVRKAVPPAPQSIVSLIGKAVTKVRGQARFDSFVVFKNFEDVIGSQGSLIYSEEPSGIPVVFVAMRRNRVTPHDIHLAALEFWILPLDAVIQQASVISR
jgi:hypothetical protein